MLKTELILLSMKTAVRQHFPCAILCLSYSALTWEEDLDFYSLTTGFPDENAGLADSWVSGMSASPFRHWLILSGHFLWVGRQVSHGHGSLSHPGFRPLLFFFVGVSLENRFLYIWFHRFGLLVGNSLAQTVWRRLIFQSSFLKLDLESRWCVLKHVLWLAVQNNHPWEDSLKGGAYTASLRLGSSELLSVFLEASCVSWGHAQMPTCPGVWDRLSQGRIYTRPWLSTQSSQRIRCFS